jgi:hypothetical protein
VEPVRPAAAVPPPAAAPRTAIADVFSALLAVEQGEPGAQVPMAQPPAPPIDTDAIASDVTERVLARLQAQAGDVQDMVSRIVSEVAERLVREEIARIRNK